LAILSPKFEILTVLEAVSLSRWDKLSTYATCLRWKANPTRLSSVKRLVKKVIIAQRQMLIFSFLQTNITSQRIHQM